jgi:hypothetical protein
MSFERFGRKRDLEVCGSCGLKDERVECGGIYHCPNRFCTISGAFNHRVKAGYHGEDGVLTESGRQMLIRDCLVEIAKLGPGPMRRAIRVSLDRWRERK